MVETDAIFAGLEEAARPTWLEDPNFLAASAFYAAHGHLDLSQWRAVAPPEERALAEGLAIRQVLVCAGQAYAALAAAAALEPSA